MIDLIIFDVDGTMIDTEKAVMESYNYAIKEEFERCLSEEELSAAYGIPTIKAMERLGILDTEKACGRYYEHLFKAFAEVMPFEGIVELLEEVQKQGICCGIVTSRNRSEVEKDVSLQKLMKYFKYVICAEDTKKHKPDAEPALKLIEKAGTDVTNAVYLGDTYYDYMCAKNAGVKFALASWGARNTDGIEADYVLDEPNDLLALF